MNYKKIDGIEKRAFLANNGRNLKELIKKGHINLAYNIIIDLLKDFPYDFDLMLCLARIYTINHQYEDAIKLYEQLYQIFNFKDYEIYLIGLYVKLNMTDKLYNLYQKYCVSYNEYDYLNFDYLDNYLFQLNKIYLNKLFNSNYKLNENTYLGYKEQQLYSYNSQIAINHIIERHVNNDASQAIFNSFIDINQLFNKVYNYISINPDKSQIYNVKNLCESYLFYYSNCGLNSNVYTNYFRVISIINTPHIITMWPTKFIKNHDICYLDNLNKVQKEGKIKSGLERFNNRYNN